MPSVSKQVRLPFENLTEAGLKPLLKKFATWKCPVASVDAPNKAKRESGFLVKNFTLTFEDGQKMLVRVKADGTVFQVKLNNKVVPIRHVDDLDKAVIELVDYVQENARAYERAKIQREKRKLLPPKPSITLSRKEKLKQSREALQQLTDSNQDLEGQVASSQSDVDRKSEQLAAAETSLARERDKTKKLQEELEEIQKKQGV